MATPPPPPPGSGVESPISGSPVPGSASEKRISSSSRQVTRFRDRYGMVRPYCGTFGFEWNPNYDPSEDCDTEDEEDVNQISDPIPTAIKYVNQIRLSFGFDVDYVAPSWLCGGFIPIDMSEAKHDDEKLYDRVLKTVDFTIKEINVDMSGSGKRIELLQLEKAVSAAPSMKLLTLKVKVVDDATAADVDVDDTEVIQAIIFEGYGSYPPFTLEQWRFKTHDANDIWYQPPPLELPTNS